MLRITCKVNITVMEKRSFCKTSSDMRYHAEDGFKLALDLVHGYHSHSHEHAYFFDGSGKDIFHGVFSLYDLERAYKSCCHEKLQQAIFPVLCQIKVACQVYHHQFPNIYGFLIYCQRLKRFIGWYSALYKAFLKQTLLSIRHMQ